MSRIQQLRAQAAMAERLARGALDRLTVERLTAMSLEYRQIADRLETAPDPVLTAERAIERPTDDQRTLLVRINQLI